MKIKLLKLKEAKGEYINSPETIADLMKEEANADRECLWVLHLNNANHVIGLYVVQMFLTL